MKKLLSVILAVFVITALFVLPASASEDAAADIPSRVEIAFRVGDSILSINGAEVEVETPYIAGEGTTLVPIRVITEAFGAKVGWIAESKTITLEYPDVNITLQIDNTTAIVNTHTETLAVAPTLSPNGVTMVPLRFISETFGADVGWNGETSQITVTKEFVEEGSTVTDAVKLAKLGDSYYNWMMDTPKNMFMSDRTFDGIYTEFTDDNDNLLKLEIFECKEDFSFDEDFSRTKTIFDGYTFMKADKLKDSLGNPYMHFQVKNKNYFIDYRGFYYNNRMYDLYFKCPVDSTERDSFTSLIDTFKIGFKAADDVYDLSNAVDGYRTFEDTKLKISIKIPENWWDVSSDKENEFAFAPFGIEDTQDKIKISVYSKSSAVNAKLMADYDYAFSSKYANKKVFTFTPVAQYMSPGGKYSGYSYSGELKLSSGTTVRFKDIFVECGDYVYNISIASENDADYENAVLSSLNLEPLSKDEIGVYIRNDIETGSTIVSKAGSWSLTLPIEWSKESESSSGGYYLHKQADASLLLSVGDSDTLNHINLSTAVSAYADSLASDKSNTIEQYTRKVDINRKEYYTFTYSTTLDSGNKVYYVYYFRLANNKTLYQFTMAMTEAYYSDALLNEYEEIVSSLTVE